MSACKHLNIKQFIPVLSLYSANSNLNMSCRPTNVFCDFRCEMTYVHVINN